MISATQAPTAVQRAVARVLGLPMHLVEVEVPRLGGGFGGKEDQATAWAVLAALAAFRARPAGQAGAAAPGGHALHRQAPPLLRRISGWAWPTTGASWPTRSTFYQNAGATADLSTGDPRAHAVPRHRHLLHPERPGHRRLLPHQPAAPTPPSAASAGPQAMFVIEAAIDQAAATLGVDRGEIQEQNLLREGDVFPYGQRVRRAARPARCWQRGRHRLPTWTSGAGRGGASTAPTPWSKKGLAVMPVCFGISFTNHAS